MMTLGVRGVLPGLRQAALRRDGGGLSDGQLLNCFLARREAAAFEALVRRHGPMVLGVCRRVLGNRHDAEDAFQATFLILVRRAAAVWPRELVGNWLYGVAYRTALAARTAAARRKAKERQVSAMPRPETSESENQIELQTILDQELSRLPDKYRSALVLCELQGRTRQEVARRLRVPEGTLSSRLAAGKKMLAHRLRQRGVALSSGLLAAGLGSSAASACVPPALVGSTVKAATAIAVGGAAAEAIPASVAALTEGVLKTMLLNKLKITAGLLVLGVALGIGLLAHPAWAKKQGAQAPVISRPYLAAARTVQAAEAKLVKVLKADEMVMDVALSPDGSLLADVTWHGDMANITGSAVRLWNMSKAEVKLTLGEYRRPAEFFKFRRVVFSREGKLVAASAEGIRGNKVCADIKIWDVQTGQIKHTLEHDLHAHGLAFSPDGKRLATTSSDQHVHIWDVESGQEQKTLKVADTNLMSVVFSPDGKLLAAGGMELQEGQQKGEITVWEVETGAVKHTLTGLFQVWSIQFSPDGKLLAAGGGGGVSVWETESGRLRHANPKAFAMSSAFTPDGRTLVTGGGAGENQAELILWNVETGKEQGRLPGHEGMVDGVAVSRDGKTLVTGSRDKTIRVWELRKD
jgi:RNA polymerase sigma factor (sigma-70 family)